MARLPFSWPSSRLLPLSAMAKGSRQLCGSCMAGLPSCQTNQMRGGSNMMAGKKLAEFGHAQDKCQGDSMADGLSC